MLLLAKGQNIYGCYYDYKANFIIMKTFRDDDDHQI